MDLYHTTDSYGISLLNPDEATMRLLLEQLDDPGIEEAEHPDVSLVHDPSGWSVSVFPSGTVTLENLNSPDEPPFFRKTKNREQALQLWLKLSHGKIEEIRSEDWQKDPA